METKAKELSTQMAAKANQPEAIWSVAVGKAWGLLSSRWMSEAELEALVLASSSPQQLVIFVGYAHKAASEDTYSETVLSRVDNSDYNLAGWLKAVEIFHNWLTQHHKTTNLEMMLGYLACYTDGSPNTPTELGFAEVVLGMLEQYGFDG